MHIQQQLHSKLCFSHRNPSLLVLLMEEGHAPPRTSDAATRAATAPVRARSSRSTPTCSHSSVLCLVTMLQVSVTMLKRSKCQHHWEMALISVIPNGN